MTKHDKTRRNRDRRVVGVDGGVGGTIPAQDQFFKRRRQSLSQCQLLLKPSKIVEEREIDDAVGGEGGGGGGDGGSDDEKI